MFGFKCSLLCILGSSVTCFVFLLILRYLFIQEGVINLYSICSVILISVIYNLSHYQIDVVLIFVAVHFLLL